MIFNALALNMFGVPNIRSVHMAYRSKYPYRMVFEFSREEKAGWLTGRWKSGQYEITIGAFLRETGLPITKTSHFSLFLNKDGKCEADLRSLNKEYIDSIREDNNARD